MPIITAWFEAPQSERLPKVSFLIITIGLNCRSARLAETQVMVSGKQVLKETQETGVPSPPLSTGFNQLDAYVDEILEKTLRLTVREG